MIKSFKIEGICFCGKETKVITYSNEYERFFEHCNDCFKNIRKTYIKEYDGYIIDVKKGDFNENI